LGAAAATVAGAVTGDEALQAAGVEGLRETGADLGVSAASLVVPGLPAPALKGGIKAAEAAGDAAQAAKGGAKAGKAGGQGDRQKNGRPGDNTRQNKQVRDAARAEKLTPEQRRELGRMVETESRKGGENLGFNDIREMAKEIKTSVE
jgi:hypothetical protein